MMKYGYILLAAGLLAGCSETAVSSVSPETGEKSENSPTVTTVSDTTYFSDRDLIQGYDESEAIRITGSQNGIQSDGDVDVTDRLITITEAGVYVLTGTFDEVQIKVEADDTDKVQIVLENATITNSTSACIYVDRADKLFVTFIGESSLTHGGAYETQDDVNVNGVIFSRCDLTLNGTGTVYIEDDNGNGVVSRDDLAITGGSYTVNVSGHGFRGQEHIAISDGVFDITCGKDGFHSENDEDENEGILYVKNGTFTVNAQDDGFSCSGTATFVSGAYDIVTGGGSSAAVMQTETMPGRFGFSTTVEDESETGMKGIKSDGSLLIQGGTYTFDTQDDAIHCNADITIENGQFTIRSGDDGIHSETTVTLKDGTYTISYCYEGIEGKIVTVDGGVYDITANDDGINATNGTSNMVGVSDGSSVITVNGGTITVVSDGDSLDSNGDIVVNGGTLNLTCNGNGNTAIDTDGTFTNQGGDITTNDGSENGSGGFGGMKGGVGGQRPGMQQGQTPPSNRGQQAPSAEGGYGQSA